MRCNSRPRAVGSQNRPPVYRCRPLAQNILSEWATIHPERPGWGAVGPLVQRIGELISNEPKNHSEVGTKNPDQSNGLQTNSESGTTMGELFMTHRLTTNNQNGGPAPAPRRLASLVVFLLFNDLAFYFGGSSPGCSKGRRRGVELRLPEKTACIPRVPFRLLE